MMGAMKTLIAFTAGAAAVWLATRPSRPEPFPRPGTPAEYARKV